MDTALLISLLMFTVAVLFCSAIFYYVDNLKERRKLIEKIKQSGEQSKSGESVAGSLPSGNVIKKYFLKLVSLLGHRTRPKNEEKISRVRRSFLNAGYRGQNTTIVFLGIKTLLVIVLTAGFCLLKLFFLRTITPGYFIILSILFALIGFYSPDAWLKLRIAKRKEKIMEGFPDALDLLVVCVEAGMGLDAAIKRVGEEMKLSNEILSEELNQLNLELRAGKPRQSALRNLAIRTGLEEMSNFVTLLIQTDRFGTSVARALRVHSESMRTRRYQKAEETATKLPVKLVFPLILFILPTLFITILGPAAIKIIRVLIPTVLK